MKTLIGTAIGALLLGGLLTAQAMKSPSDEASRPVNVFDARAMDAPAGPVLVNCGEGHRALVKPAVGGSHPVSQVECVPETALLQGGLAPAYQPLSTVSASAPVRERVVYRDRPVYRSSSSPTYQRTVYEPRPTQTTRSWKKSALIIGGSAAAGAGVGAIVDGGGGAKKGAVIGGVAGTVYDLATRSKTRYE